MESVKSPCVGKCKIDKGQCRGCGRTLSEISEWRDMTNEQRRNVLTRIEVDRVWPDFELPPINLLVLHSARFLSILDWCVSSNRSRMFLQSHWDYSHFHCCSGRLFVQIELGFRSIKYLMQQFEQFIITTNNRYVCLLRTYER